MPTPIPTNGRDLVVLAGSGRSGTTWLGALLSSYERADYFYEIDHFPELDFDHPGLLRAKYPLTHWWPRRPAWALELESRLLARLAERGPWRRQARRALRIRNRMAGRADGIEVHLFKIVRLFAFALRTDELAARFGERLRVVHLIRNPFAQIASQLRMDGGRADRARRHFRGRLERILAEPRLARYHALARRHFDGPLIEQMALVWWVSNELLAEDTRLAKHRVLYEDLARRPQATLEAAFAFLEWPMSETTCALLKRTTEAGAAEAGQFSIRRDPRRALNAWRERIERHDYERIAELLAPCALLRLWEPGELALGAGDPGSHEQRARGAGS